MPSTAYPGTAAIPPLPHSSSFPGPQAATTQSRNSGSDTETEGDSKTPKRRKKIRPVSALPAPRNPSSGWDGEGWKGLSDIGGGLPQVAKSATSTPPISGLPTSRQSSLELASRPVDATTSGGFAASTSSTLRRISSLSKKHGRRLSGGFKFGTNSSTSSGGSTGGPRPLEPVVGSPSKPHKSEDLPLSPTSPTPIPSDEALRHAIRGGSVSAPSSVFKPMPSHPSVKGLDGLTGSSEADHGDSDQGPEAAAVTAEKKEKHRRRQSWNDFIIPREVMAKQKELKENIGAVKRFATGVTSLKTLLSTHAEMRDRILASGTAQDAAEFTSLESEFEQWLEMAVVLIEVGSTGADGSTQPSFSSPPRSRRVTLASDEAKKASAMMTKATSAPGGPGPGAVPPVQLAGWRKASLPDPEDASCEMSAGPPRADYPEQWRASTGRQDLSKRQLEVLRTMLRTPVNSSSGRPGLPLRAASTLSASTTNSSFLNVSPDRLNGSQTQGRVASRSRSRTPESISFPSPGDSAHVNPSASFPSPLTAARFAQLSSAAQGKTLKDRRASKAGLAGLKEFLRSLKKDKPLNSSSTGAPPAAGGGGGLSPMRIRTRFGMKASTSPPASPTSPLSPAFSRLGDGVFYPTQRSTFSALGSNQPPPSAPILGNPQPQTRSEARSPMQGHPQQISSQNQTQAPFQSRSRYSRSATLAGADSVSAASSPRLGAEHKRPSIRNIFRTSSGNWSELVRDSGSTPGTPATEHKSSTSSPGLSGLTKKLSAHRLGLGGGGSPKPNSGSRYGVSPGGSRVSVSDPMPTRIPFSNSSTTLSPAISNSSAISESKRETPKPVDLGFGTETVEGEMDRTLRPSTRKRVSGLGLGLGWPESPVKSANAAAGHAHIGGVDEMGTVYESPGRMDRTLKPGANIGQSARSGSYPTATSPIRRSSTGLAQDQGRVPSASSTTSALAATTMHSAATGKDRIVTESSSTSPTTISGSTTSEVNAVHSDIDPDIDTGSYGNFDSGRQRTDHTELAGGKDEGRADDLVVALTPENLPTLLEYLRQCESKLGEWRGRAQGLGVGAQV
ncbi:hypothetical protein IAU59_004524 [Kwoniella sp. CBS 9459]